MAMSQLGHSRPVQPVLLAGSCPLRSESDLHPALPRNDAMGQQRKWEQSAWRPIGWGVRWLRRKWPA